MSVTVAQHTLCMLSLSAILQLVKVDKLNLPFPISAEFLMGCYMSCHFFFFFAARSYCSQRTCSVILFPTEVICFFYFSRWLLFFLHASSIFSTV